MTKHVILVEGHGATANVLQKTIEVLDDYDIDFIIHWDRKYKRPNLISKKSKIFFINSIRVYWGSFRQVLVEKNLFTEAYVRGYDYAHLISSLDIPLMDVEYFKSFFKKEVYIGFSNDKNIEDRIKYYYIFLSFIKGSTSKILIQKSNAILVFFQKLMGINRIRGKKIQIRKGTNWISLKRDNLTELVNFDISIFKKTFLADELYAQTALNKFQNFDDECGSSSRYIDWNRGKPYVFRCEDIDELKKIVNTKYAFARKIEDVRIVEEIFKPK